MSVVINLHAKAKEGRYEALLETFKAILRDTVKFQGAELMSLMADPDTGSVILHEVWDSVESQLACIAWRTERGELAALIEMLREPPVFEQYDHVAF